jgi:hypothetical protein
MLAFLAGERLSNTLYCSEGIWLYLDDSGYICEEDGAGAKPHRVPIIFHNEETWWIYDYE